MEDNSQELMSAISCYYCIMFWTSYICAVNSDSDFSSSSSDIYNKTLYYYKIITNNSYKIIKWITEFCFF